MRAYKRIRNAKRVADDHDQSGGQNHARHRRGPPWIRSEFVPSGIPKAMSNGPGVRPATRCARVPTSMSSNHDYRRLAHSKQVLGRIFHTHANRKPSGQVHPVQGSLHIGKDRSQAAHHVCIRSHAEADAIHHARETRHRVWTSHRPRPAFRERCAVAGLPESWRPPTTCARRSA